MKTAVPEPARNVSEFDSEGSTRGNVQDPGAVATVPDRTRSALSSFADAGGMLDDVLRSRVYETLADAILITLHGQVAYANSAARRLFGDEPGDGSIASATLDRMHPGSRSAVASAIEETLRTGAPARSLRGSAIGHGGRVFDFDATLSRLHWNGAQGCLLSLREFTRSQLGERPDRATGTRVAELEVAKAMQDGQSGELGELAVRLAEAKDVADAASRTKSEFLANMSHELRTPLNAIMGFSEVIKHEMFGAVGVPQYVDYASDIYASGAHLLEIINDILDLSKVEAGKLEVAEERLELRAVAESVFQLVKGRADEGGVTLMHDIAKDLPRLYADKRKLKQMLLNLLSNAIKFTHQGGAVDLVARVSDDGGLVIRVRDTGIGIAAGQFDLVLAPFGQVDSALAREHQGTGLGLPLVKALVELHDGHLILESEPGAGTNVSLCFPPDRTR